MTSLRKPVGSALSPGNETEDWQAAQPLFEECLTLAESNSLRSRLEDDLEMLASNVARQRAARRTEASSAPSPSGAAQGQPMSRKRPASTTSPSKKRGLVIGSVIAAAIVLLLIIIGNSNNDSSSHEPAPRPTPPLNSSNAPADTSNSPTTYAAPASANNSGTQGLRATIEQNQTRLRQMESDLSNLDAEIAKLKSEIETDKASLTQMKRDNDQGYQVDSDLYETTRMRHNKAVETSNGLVNDYNSTLLEYKRLLNSHKYSDRSV